MLSLLRPYRFWIAALVVLGLACNGLNLVLPGLIGQGINGYLEHGGLSSELLSRFGIVVGLVALLGSLQNLVQVHASEQVARDMRRQLAEKISIQNLAFVVERDPARLLTNLTSDVDAIKLFVSQVISNLISSGVVLIGAAILLLRLDLLLGLSVLSILPLIGLIFFFVIRRVRPLFTQSREVVDRLNRVVQANIVGAALVRVLNAHTSESRKFEGANSQALNIGMGILRNFAFMIPAVVFFSNLGTLIILSLGGWLVLHGRLELGDIAECNSYLAMVIFPIFVLGFMSNLIAQAQASYQRVAQVLTAQPPPAVEKLSQPLRGEVELREVRLSYGEKEVLKGISFHLQPGSRNAIVGPTAAGKTQLLSVMAGLLNPSSGSVLYDGKYQPAQLQRQLGVVFQESALFSGTLKQNIAFHPEVTPGGWRKAMAAAELEDLLAGLPQGEETPVSERGSTLSGGQKQRVTLARALALEPNVLLLDDFTARLDPATEQRVRHNLEREYPGMTVLAVTQRIATIADYDQIFLLMEGELLARGTHQELLESCPEYAQIYDSQKSTHHYE
jgi:ATP-binding cassette subfamily B protein